MKKTIRSPLITNITSDSINSYFNDIKDFKLLTREEELMYLKMRNTNFDYAIKKLMEGNLRLVITIAKMYQYCNIPLEDLIQIGNLGLYKALVAYDDSTYTTKLADYISYKIRGEILNEITTEAHGIHLPRYVSDKTNQVLKFINTYVQENGYDPDGSTIAEALDIELDKVNNILDLIHLDVFSEVSDNDDNTTDIFDTIVCNESIKISNPRINEILKSTLNEQEYYFILDFFGFNGMELTNEDIAKKYNVTDIRVRFVISNALKKLRKVPELLKFI